MPRIIGIDIPKEKRIEIALTYIHGIGRARANDILDEAGIPPDKRAKDLDETGLAVDFRVIKDKTQDVLKELDHTFLNELPPFKDDNPSSERIAQYIYKQLSELLNNDRIWVARVTAWESDTACASYFEDER